MKYFTPELYLKLQDFSSDKAMDAAGAAWECAAQRYQRSLKRLHPRLPRGLRALQEKYYLHDAEVLSMGRQGRSFILVLRLDTPPRELLILRYRLAKEAVIRMSALPSRAGSGPVQWMYDEIDLVRGECPGIRHAILFSNGWEVDLCLLDVMIQKVEAIYPVPGTMLIPVASGPVPKSA